MYRIKEYAMPLDKIGMDLRGVSGRLVEHLLKIFYYRNSTGDYNHWVTEVYAFVNSVPMSKKSHKPPKKDFIKKNLWGYKSDIFHILHENIVDGFIMKYGPISLDIRAGVFCDEYIDWLSGRLSKGYSVSIREVVDYIKILIKRYPV